MILCAGANMVFTDAAIESTNEVERQLSFRRSLLSEPRREQTRPSTSESQRHSSDITGMSRSGCL